MALCGTLVRVQSVDRARIFLTFWIVVRKPNCRPDRMHLQLKLLRSVISPKIIVLLSLIWLRVARRYCISKDRPIITTRGCLHGIAPSYIAETLQLTSDNVNMSSSSVCSYANSCRPVDRPYNTRRPNVSRGCCSRLERSSLFAKSCSVTDVVQALP